MIKLAVEIPVLAASLIVLAVSSHYTINYVERMIELTGLSEASAGFLILSIATSTPEVAVALFSVLEGKPGVSVGDIIGSNVFNVCQ